MSEEEYKFNKNQLNVPYTVNCRKLLMENIHKKTILIDR